MPEPGLRYTWETTKVETGDEGALGVRHCRTPRPGVSTANGSGIPIERPTSGGDCDADRCTETW
jgi:hypothetical protein